MPLPVVLAINLNIILFTILGACQTQCYLPNGDVMEGDQPCNANKEVTGCCGSGDWCTTSGLCINHDGSIARGSCTDRSWGQECPRFCMNTTVSGQVFYPCENWGSGQKFACGDSPAACVGEHFGIGEVVVNLREYQIYSAMEINGIMSPTGTPSDAPALSTSVTDTTTNPTITPETGGPSDTYGPRTLAGVGAGIGVPLAVGLVGALCMLVKERRRSRQLAFQLQEAFTEGYHEIKLKPGTAVHAETNIIQNGVTLQ